MIYIVSKVRLGHKPGESDYGRGYIFRQDKEGYLSVPDNPNTLCEIIEMGWSVKPVFSNSPEDAIAQTLILDFDELTRDQYHEVIRIANEHGYPHCDSAGMRQHLKECGCLENATKWRHKVFFPINAGNVYSEIEKCFFDACRIFNPGIDDQVIGLWLKANNRSSNYKHDSRSHKKGDPRPVAPSVHIDLPIFKGHVLPDVAMLKNFRGQITFGVAMDLPIEMREKRELGIDAPRLHPVSVSKFETIGRLPWKTISLEKHEAFDKVDIDKEKFNDLVDKFAELLMDVATGMDIGKYRPCIPTSRSQFARMMGIKRSGIVNDLVFDSDYPRLLNCRLWRRDKRPSGHANDAFYHDLLKFLYTTRMELKRHGVNLKTEDIVKDLVFWSTKMYGTGYQVWDYWFSPNPEIAKKAFYKWCRSMARNMVKWEKNYDLIRENIVRKQYKSANVESIPGYLETLAMIRNGDKSKYEVLKTAVSNWITEHESEIDFHPDYHFNAKGLKEGMIEEALRIDDLEFNPTVDEIIDTMIKGQSAVKARFMTKDEFADFVCLQNDGCICENVIKNWYPEYRREWKRRYEQSTGIDASRMNVKKHKQHKGKWADLSKTMTKDELKQRMKEEGCSRALIHNTLKRLYD